MNREEGFMIVWFASLIWFAFLTTLLLWNCTRLKEISHTVAELKREIKQMQIRDFPPVEDEPILLSGPDYYDENSTTIH